MLISRCPLRVSLCGGGSDLESYIQKYNHGAVISFPSNLYTYITVFQDKYGYNKQKKYIINYTKREEVDDVKEIKNDIARLVLEHFKCKHITVDFRSDVFTAGSGLASSSAYLIACIKAVARHSKVRMEPRELCELAIKIERKFNPLTGYHDIYGCALKGLKRCDFYPQGRVENRLLDEGGGFINNFRIYLRPTGILRSSTHILSTLNLEKIKKLMPLVEKMTQAIQEKNTTLFIELINEGWKIKKLISPLITKDEKVREMDEKLLKDSSVLAHRLCGAGNGGFFLIFKENACLFKGSEDIEIKLSRGGAQIINI